MPKTAEAPDTTAIQHIIDISERNNGLVRHEFSDPLQVRYLNNAALSNGLTPQRYPELFRVLAGEAGPYKDFAPGDPNGNTGAFVDNQTVDFVGQRANGVAAARGTFTRTKPIATATVFIYVVNVTNGQTKVAAFGYVTQFNTQTINVDTNDATASPLPTTGTNSGLLSWAVQYQDGSSESNSGNSFWGFNTSQDPTVTDPVQNPNRHTGDMNSIVIGLSRGFNSPANNTDVDYWFWQTQWQNTTLLVPLSGSMQFLYPIAALGPGNPILQFWLARQEGGMSELSVANTAPYVPFFTIGANNSQLTFSLLAGSNSAGNAINFGVSPWVADTKTYFSGKVSVVLSGPNGPTNGWSSILSADTQDNDPTDGVTYIKPIVYVWHCLAAGTLVTMSDGTTQPIENLNSGNVVQSGSTTRNVLATLAQPHWGTVYTVTLQSGKSITCSGTHPVMTSGGAVQVSSLATGQQVLTNSGTDTVSSITTSQQSGAGLFNIWLDPGPAGQTVFYAAGILVGDYQIQVSLLNQANSNPESVRAKLPARLHRDFDSYLEDKLAHAK